MATQYLVPVVPLLQILSNQGVIGSGYRIYTYVGGSTSTPLTTYTDATGVTQNANPVVVDGGGRFSLMWVPAGTLVKLVLKDGNDVTISGGTFDNIPAINDLTAVLASPPGIGGTTPGAGAFTTLSASGAVSGAGFTALLASPTGPIGTTAPAGGRFTYAYTAPVAVTFSATAMSVDCNLSNVFTTTFTANVTVAPSINNPHDGQTINWFITQDGVGSRTMTWPSSFKWPGGSAGVLSTPVNSVDLLVATYRASTGFWYATLAKAFA